MVERKKNPNFSGSIFPLQVAKRCGEIAKKNLAMLFFCVSFHFLSLSLSLSKRTNHLRYWSHNTDFFTLLLAFCSITATIVGNIDESSVFVSAKEIPMILNPEWNLFVRKGIYRIVYCCEIWEKKIRSSKRLA